MTSTPAGVGKYLGQDMDFTSLTTIEASMQTGLCRKIFVCPSDKQGGRYGTTVAGDTSGGAHWTSYAFNEAALGWADKAAGLRFPRMRGHAARWPHAGNLVILMDANPRASLPYVTDDPSSWMLLNANVPSVTLGDWWRRAVNQGSKDAGDPALMDQHRHRGRIIVGCADGHAENNMLDGSLDKFSINMDMENLFE
jgi:hypothetical protein